MFARRKDDASAATHSSRTVHITIKVHQMSRIMRCCQCSQVDTSAVCYQRTWSAAVCHLAGQSNARKPCWLHAGSKCRHNCKQQEYRPPAPEHCPLAHSARTKFYNTLSIILSNDQSMWGYMGWTGPEQFALLRPSVDSDTGHTSVPRVSVIVDITDYASTAQRTPVNNQHHPPKVPKEYFQGTCTPTRSGHAATHSTCLLYERSLVIQLAHAFCPGPQQQAVACCHSVSRAASCSDTKQPMCTSMRSHHDAACLAAYTLSSPLVPFSFLRGGMPCMLLPCTLLSLPIKDES